MKEQYERIVLTVTYFDCEDVITTSVVDRHNAYSALEDLSGSDSRDMVFPVGF